MSLISAFFFLNIKVFQFVWYLPRMKRSLPGNDQEDEGGSSSSGSQGSLKRSCKQRMERDSTSTGARWECLPQEVLLHIFQYLPLLDRAYASQVPVSSTPFQSELRTFAEVLWLLLSFYRCVGAGTRFSTCQNCGDALNLS